MAVAFLLVCDSSYGGLGGLTAVRLVRGRGSGTGDSAHQVLSALLLGSSYDGAVGGVLRPNQLFLDRNYGFHPLAHFRAVPSLGCGEVMPWNVLETKPPGCRAGWGEHAAGTVGSSTQVQPGLGGS